MDLNKATIVGRLTRDPEARTTPSGINVTSFGVATNFAWTDAEGNRKESVEFHNVVAWRKLGEIVAQYLRKGNRVLIEGRLQTRTWEGQDGAKRNRTEIIAGNLIMLDSRGRQEGETTTQEPVYSQPVSSQEQTKKTEPEEDPSRQGSPRSGGGAGEAEAEEISVEDIPF